MLVLLLLCILMFFGCYLAGYIPLAFNYSPSNLRIITIFGAGLLVGAALAIIIPEGVATIYDMQVELRHSDENAQIESRHLAQAEEVKLDVRNAALVPEAKQIPGEHSSLRNTHGLIGVALTLGFVVMFLVDHLGAGSCCKVCARPLSSVFPFCCRFESKDLILPIIPGDVEGGESSSSALAAAEHSAMTTTLGLVVHSIADGIAVGAAFGLTLDLTLILFAPAAFGFVSFLVHEGLPRNRVRVYLLAFALASPVGALLTYLIVSIHTYATLDPVLSASVGTSTTGTGFALLLSGGTFLYVATAHILPHLNSDKAVSSSSGLANTAHHRHQAGDTFKPSESLAFVLGCCFPVIISFSHSH
ncbi:unnamed protein product [Mesocestoides corti]|uniref:Zinc/iron permease n=1 Tax=Mesocestoides corti TaxID=53468 RepID=A0A0R3U6Z3_MESCO|nr:unnamed protein product [Mesocestoides corti]